MLGKLQNPLRWFWGLKSLYGYIWQRLLIRMRSSMKTPPVYPFEIAYGYDPEVLRVLQVVHQGIPVHQQGDNEAFHKDWSSVYEREAEAKKIIAVIQKATKAASLPCEQAQLQDLSGIGYARISNKNLSASEVDQFLAHLKNQPVYPSHVAHFSLQKPMPFDEVKKSGSAFGSYDLSTIFTSPMIAKIVADRQVIGLISNYFGCLPTISSVNLFWSFLSPDGKPKGPQHFHRDVDDYKTCTMFINLTDTAPEDGAHCYIPQSHQVALLEKILDDKKNDTLPAQLNPFNHRLKAEDFFQLPLNGYSFEKLYSHFFSDKMVNLYGPKGTVLVTDNYGIHRGIPPKTQDRLILWVSFALTATHTQSAQVMPQKRVAYTQVGASVEDNEINRYVLRNIIDFRR